MKNSKRNFFAFMAGLAVGVMTMFAFQLITPFLEIYYFEVTEIGKSEDYFSALKNNFFLSAFYVFSWATTVFLAAFCTEKFLKKIPVQIAFLAGEFSI